MKRREFIKIAAAMAPLLTKVEVNGGKVALSL